MNVCISSALLARMLSVPDLTQRGEHAVALMAQDIAAHLVPHYPSVAWIDGPKVVPAAHNHGLLGYADDDITQADVYTKWVDPQHVLRTQATSLVVGTLLAKAADPQAMTIVAPAMVYRRDVRDRWHCGEPHQMDVWVVYPKHSAWDISDALKTLVEHIMQAAHVPWRTSPTQHPYTTNGLEIEAQWDDRWLEVGECGEIAEDVLARLGWDTACWTGLAIGVGLDRMVMVRKQLPDIRLLRAPEPRIAQQMLDLTPWREVSRMPQAARDLSVVRNSTDNMEHLTELVVEASGMHAHWVEEVQILAQHDVATLPQQAQERLGGKEWQKNVLLRVVLRDMAASIPKDTANAVLRKIYRAIHQGSQWTYCP